jgi:hypothetical protein
MRPIDFLVLLHLQMQLIQLQNLSSSSKTLVQRHSSLYVHFDLSMAQLLIPQVRSTPRNCPEGSEIVWNPK